LGTTENILTNCIREIKSGKATLSECLDRYPSKRRELEPLLKIALNIYEPPAMQLDESYKQAAKARLLQQIRTAKQKQSRSLTDIFSFGISPRLVWARAAMSVLVIIILLSMSAGGTAYAAQGSLPGDILYPVKLGTEDARLLVAGGNSAKAELNLNFAQIRLVEMSKLVNKDEERVQLAIKGYQENLEAALVQIRMISDASALYHMFAWALEDMQKQMTFCDNVIDGNPAYFGRVNEATSLAINQQVELLKMLAQQDILQATQANLNMMQNRLQRAQVKASGNQYQMMEEALLQYQVFSRLGGRILQSSQVLQNHSAEIEALSLQATTTYLDTLNALSQHVPQEYQSIIETSRQATMQFQSQAGYGFQKHGTDSAQGNSRGDGGTSPGDGSSGSGSGTSPGDGGSGSGSGTGQGDGGSGSGSGTGPGDGGSGSGSQISPGDGSSGNGKP